MRCYQSGPEWSRDRWQWRGSLRSQRSSITGASLSDCFVSYRVHSLGETYPFVEIESVYSTAPAVWARRKRAQKKSYHCTLFIQFCKYSNKSTYIFDNNGRILRTYRQKKKKELNHKGIICQEISVDALKGLKAGKECDRFLI